MNNNLLLDSLDDKEASSFWNVSAIRLGVLPAQAVEYLKTLDLPSGLCYAFASLPEDGFVLTTELKTRIELSDILVVAVGNEEALPALATLAGTATEYDVTSIGLIALPYEKRRDCLEELKLRNTGLASLNAMIPVWERQPVDLRDEDTAHTGRLQDVLCDLVDILTLKDCLSIDYADLRDLLRHRGNCAYGMGCAEGAAAELKALDAALEDMRLQTDKPIDCLGVLIYIRARKDLKMSQYEAILTRCAERVGRDAAIVVGLSLLETMLEQVVCSILVTGMPSERELTYVQLLSISTSADDLNSVGT